jgi:death on curing protein
MTEENSSPVNYLDEKILKELAHEIACQIFQEEEPMGLYEDHDQAKLDSCLNLPRQAVFGKDLYPGVFKKAAITFYAFNRNHAFGNGNKRLSVAVLVEVDPGNRTKR